MLAAVTVQMPPTHYLSPFPLSFSMFLIFSSSDYIMIQSHFCEEKKRRGCHHSLQFLPFSSRLSPSCPVSGSCEVPLLLILQMALWWGSRDCAEWEVLFAHACRAALSDNTNGWRPTPLTSPPLGICCQILFHFHTNHLERGGRPHSAGRMLCRPCGLVYLCTAHTLLCYYSTKLLCVLCCLLLSHCMVTLHGHCVSLV